MHWRWKLSGVRAPAFVFVRGGVTGVNRSIGHCCYRPPSPLESASLDSCLLLRNGCDALSTFTKTHPQKSRGTFRMTTKHPTWEISPAVTLNATRTLQAQVHPESAYT